MLHAWLAIPGLGDVEVTVLENPFNKEEEKWLVDDGGMGELGQGDRRLSGGGKKDVKDVKEAEQKRNGENQS